MQTCYFSCLLVVSHLKVLSHFWSLEVSCLLAVSQSGMAEGSTVNITFVDFSAFFFFLFIPAVTISTPLTSTILYHFQWLLKVMRSAWKTTCWVLFFFFFFFFLHRNNHTWDCFQTNHSEDPFAIINFSLPWNSCGKGVCHMCWRP